MPRLFISDLHLDDPGSPGFRAFAALLERAAARVDEIYLLGDLCEVWIGDDDDGDLATSFVATVARAASRAHVFVMAGNRDFLFGEQFERASGARLIDDPCRLDDGVLLSHGDAFCVDDEEYQRIRRQLRSADWRRDILARPLTERRELARAMRRQSRETNANKAANIMDVSAGEVDRVMAEHDAHTLIHGHTHRPGIHQHTWGRRYVLGAWERCGWRVEQRTAGLELLCFPLASGSAPTRDT